MYKSDTSAEEGSIDRRHYLPTNEYWAALPQKTLPEVMYSLTCLNDLSEIGLVLGHDLDAQELYQQILTHIRRVVRTDGACLLRYYREQQRFVSVASQGEKLPCGLLATLVDGHEMEQVARRGPGSALDMRHIQQYNVLLVTLSCAGTLMGCLALALVEGDSLLDARSLLLTYMANVAAQILYNFDQYDRERQELVEQERKRIARDLHDGVAQQIAYTLQKLELIQRLLEQQNPAAITETQRAIQVLHEGLYDLRTNIATLMPAQENLQTLPEALQTLLQDARLRNPGLTLSPRLDALQQVPPRLVVPIFRLVQEALNNIYKHAHASQVTINTYRKDSFLVVEVSDNGIGLLLQDELQQVERPQGQLKEHIGLRVMRERVQEVGGTWQISSPPGKGTTIRASFPLTATNPDLTTREREVLRLLVAGLTNRDIADQLAISNDTVKTHVHHIMQKLQVKDRIQAAVLAARHGWL